MDKIQTHLTLDKILEANSDEWNEIITLISSAQKSIYISTFFIEPDHFGYTFLELLTQAALRGVRCILVTDQTGSRLASYMHKKNQDTHMSRSLDNFKKSGGHHIVFRPLKASTNLLSKFVMGGNHFKFFIFDNEKAIITGRNIGQTSFSRWEDFGLLVRGPIVFHLQNTFSDLLKLSGQNHLIPDPVPCVAYRAHAHNSELEVIYLDFDPIHHGGRLHFFAKKIPNSITQYLLALIESAQTEIIISSFMFKPTGALRHAILNAARRGVRVRLVTSGINALPDGKIAYWAAACGYPELLHTNQVEIHETRIPEHSKLVLIDRSHAGVGSYNLEFAAHDRLREGMIFSQAPALLSAVEKSLLSKLSADKSRKITHCSLDRKTRLAYSALKTVRWFF